MSLVYSGGVTQGDILACLSPDVETTLVQLMIGKTAFLGGGSPDFGLVAWQGASTLPNPKGTLPPCHVLGGLKSHVARRVAG
jgi:hypothetical protein